MRSAPNSYFPQCIDIQKKFSLIGVELNIIQVICIFIVRNAEEKYREAYVFMPLCCCGESVRVHHVIFEC